MKKLLVTLLLVAGLVTIASAEQLDCINNTTNQCCIDVTSITNAISQSPSHSIPANNEYPVTKLDQSLTVISRLGCEDTASYIDQDGVPNTGGSVTWVPGDWAHTSFLFPHH